MSSPGAPAALTLDDVLDLRAYERVREEYRAKVIRRKRLRRVELGPIMTLVFECLDTVRFQVQEMARVEKIISDEAIQVELDIYNRLLPQVGELSATLFIELTTEAALREWLPRLVGIERALGVDVDGEVVHSLPEAEHGAALTRGTVTPAVHYLRFGFSPAQVAAFAGAGEVALVAAHPAYSARTPLRPEARGAPGRPARHNKAASPGLTWGKLCVALYRPTGRRPYSSFAGIRCRRRRIHTGCAPDQGEYCPYPTFARKCFP